MFQVKVLNNISDRGLAQFSKEKYHLSNQVENPDAILVRSFDMHPMEFSENVQVVGRAGAGTNNIPVERLTKRGVPVLNTPGANANAVKELVVASLLVASRNICKAWHYVEQLEISDAVELHHHVEQKKKQFVGGELPGKTLGIIGLGNIGVQVANSAYQLGMRVIGYDASITVKNAWQLSSNVEQAENIDQVFQQSDFISLHIPLMEVTKNLINEQKLSLFKKNAVLLNFAREGIIDNVALLQALNDNRVSGYICDFPDPLFRNNPKVICLPHLGASTNEAEENCAMMIARQVKSFLEDGYITNAVNFPDVRLQRVRSESYRLAVVNANIPNMVAQISTVLSNHKVNIIDMINKSKGDIAYTLMDINSPLNEEVLRQIKSIDGVVRARQI